MRQARAEGRKLWRLPLTSVAVVGAGLIVYVAWQISSGSPGNADFYLNRGKYESIVARSKALPLAPGEQTHTSFDGLGVDIGRNSEGSYTVTITTVDRGHAGASGYVFSDEPLTPHPNANYPEYSSVENPGDMPFSDTPIVGQGGRWWSVYNNLL
jgi:hypothetical protein